MKLYVAGPMRGYAQFNFAKFDEVCKSLRSKGHTVIGPQEIDRYLGFDETVEELEVTQDDMRRFLLRDTFLIILEAEGIVTLPGWEESKGAIMEVALARAMGLPVYDDEMFELIVDIKAYSWIHI